MKKNYTPQRRAAIKILTTSLYCLLCLAMLSTLSYKVVRGQDTVSGAFEGTVTDSQTGAAIEGATIEIVNEQTQVTITRRSNTRGRWYQGLLQPGLYIIRISAPNYQTKQIEQRLFITRTGEVVPVPVALDPAPTTSLQPSPTPSTAATPAAAATPSATPSATPATTATPAAAATPAGAAAGAAAQTATLAETDIRARINASDASRGDSFTEEEVSTLPLGAITITRTFDELALLLPGVAAPPQTVGNGSGPGIGAGVGSAGQFSVNGLRSRSNNFTVDGSDNNDEDIGVRRQGFVALNSQPIESVREYQVTTLLAPAQFGRNIGGQVNAVSKGGGSATHGTLYGFLNSSRLNSISPFDTTFGNTPFQLRAGNNQPVIFRTLNANGSIVNQQPLTVTNGSSGKDSFTFGQFGATIGGAIKKGKLFYFFSAEREIINAVQEASFAVPTIEQRGAFNSGATGITTNPYTGGNIGTFPSTAGGDAVFSLYPFPNNPRGIYGANTFTDTLPASGKGSIFSFRLDDVFRWRAREQSVTGRYNYTQDARTIPVTGEAIFSSLRPNVRTQNFSFFFNSQVSAPDARKQMFNQLRLSYGRTRLRFGEVRDTQYQVPSKLLPNEPFLLNAPLIANETLPSQLTNGLYVPNTGNVYYDRLGNFTTEDALGPVGQVKIAGFSPIGVDVFNFPQNRVDNTYQIADNFNLRAGEHNLVFGADMRRTELNSYLPRNARPLLVFGGAPNLTGDYNAAARAFENLAFSGFINPATLAAASAPSVFSQTLSLGNDSEIGLRFYQYNFFGQDTWRIRRNLSVSFGLRYEYNTPPREMHRRIEDSFNDPALDLISGIKGYIGGRTSIFRTSRNNFAPRVGVAYSPNPLSGNHLTVIRGGYGIFYDIILGAVVSQSRNVYPDYLTINLAGGFANLHYVGGCDINFSDKLCPIDLANPQLATINGVPIVKPGTLNTVNPAVSFAQLVTLVRQFGTGGGILPSVSGFGATLPAKNLLAPRAQQFDFVIEQQLGRRMTLSVAYVGTIGQRLLRFTTPNLGENTFVLPLDFCLLGCPSGQFMENYTPYFHGLVLPPGVSVTPSRDDLQGGRPDNSIGAINRFETTARSRYDSLQVQLRGRLQNSLQYQVSYVWSHALDDASDVFDLAGASALPQDNFNFAAEYGNANFDTRHRLSYDFIYDVPSAKDRRGIAAALLNNWQIAGTGRIQSGQLFTVNSIYDVNLDGNLTDRLNTTQGLVITGDRSHPLRLTVDPSKLVAPIGQDGAVGRNTFRAGGIVELDLAFNKRFIISERQNLLFRAEIFNFINRANYGIPVRFLEAPGFGTATNLVTPMRRLQFALKYNF
jgi:hypothetical protein